MRKGKLQLDLKSRMLFRGNRIFLNGDVYEVGKTAQRILGELADRLALSPVRDIDAEAQALLYQWYLDGYVYVDGYCDTADLDHASRPLSHERGMA